MTESSPLLPFDQSINQSAGNQPKVHITTGGNIISEEQQHSLSFDNIILNIKAGLAVSLINIPLSISLAVASHSTPIAGVITAIWSGLIAAMTGGSHYNIFGPTGALSGILTIYVLKFGASSLPLLALSSAVIVLIVFAMRWDRYLHLLSSSVNHGFTLGVALIIIGGQVAPAFGLPPPGHNHFFDNLYSSLYMIPQHGNLASFMLFITSWLLLFGLVRWKRSIPWSVLIAMLGIVVGVMSKRGWMFTSLQTLSDKYGELTASLYQPVVWQNQAMRDHPRDVISASMSIAFVAVLESLISAKIADAMTSTHCDTRREVLGTALANVASGLAGGLPATAALARTALNIRSGATSRIAACANAILTGSISYLLLPLFGYLPLPVVSALLFQVGIGMIESKHIVHAWHIDRHALMLTIVVALLCLLFDPTVAIVVGALVGMLYSAEQLAAGNAELILTKDYNEDRALDISQDNLADQVRHAWSKRSSMAGTFSSPHMAPQSDFQVANLASQSAAVSPNMMDLHRSTVIYRIVGDLTYLSALAHSERITRLLQVSDVILSFRYCSMIDIDGFHSIEDSVNHASKHPSYGRVFLASISPILLPRFSISPWFADLVSQGRVFNHASDALAHLSTQQNMIGREEKSSRFAYGAVW